jgi:acyl-CoA thioester hydrolase
LGGNAFFTQAKEPVTMSRITINLPPYFIFSTNIPIRIGDINRGQHLGHDALFAILEEARMRFFNGMGYTEEGIGGVSYIMVDAAVIYKRQGYYGQTLKVEIAATDITAKGCDLVHRVTDAENGDEVARAKTGILFYDYERKKVTAIPEALRERFQSQPQSVGDN